MGALCCKKNRSQKNRSAKKRDSHRDDENDENDSDEALNDNGEDEHEGSGSSNEARNDAGGGLIGWMTGAASSQADEDDEGGKKKKKKRKDEDDSDDDEGTSRKKKKKRKDDKVVLKVTIKSAKGLKDTDWIGNSDPYCIIEIPSSKKNKKRKVGRTEVCGDSAEPVWNQSFIVDCKLGDYLEFSVFDEDTFSDELLGRATLDHKMYFPFGYDGEIRLNETGQETWSFIKVSVEVQKAPKQDEDSDDGKQKKGGLSGLNFEENQVAWKKAHAVVNAMESDETLAREETTSTALETLVRLAETGLPIPHEALSRVVACLQSTDRRYRLASLMISKALGRRVKAFAPDIAEALGDDDEDVRAGACKVLGTLGDVSAPFVTELGNLLYDEVPAVRSAALEALGLLSQTDCLQALVVLGTCLDHQDKRYRLACCLILKALGVKATPHAYSLAERVEQDSSVDVKVAACGALGNMGLGAASVQPALVALYHGELDANVRVQQAAQQAIEKLKKEHQPMPPRPDQSAESGAPPTAEAARRSKRQSSAPSTSKATSAAAAGAHRKSNARQGKQPTTSGASSSRFSIL